MENKEKDFYKEVSKKCFRDKTSLADLLSTTRTSTARIYTARIYTLTVIKDLGNAGDIFSRLVGYERMIDHAGSMINSNMHLLEEIIKNTDSNMTDRDIPGSPLISQFLNHKAIEECINEYKKLLDEATRQKDEIKKRLEELLENDHNRDK